MNALPTGTVTLLFTDIEGSTLLLRHLDSGYDDALAAHRTILRDALCAHGGVEVDTQGDAFLVAFARATDAVAAAVDVQCSLAAYPWPDGGAIRIRIGVHTGQPRRTAEGYVGMDLVRGARIKDAGHGGQVLLSHATAALVETELPAGVTLRDAGAHRLKDLAHPEQLFQLVIPGLPVDFPPLRTLDTHPNNLPTQPTPLIGREQELDAARHLLSESGVRLLTFTGPGGIGKTRLGLQVAADLVDAYRDGVFFVSLASVIEPSMVASTIAQTLGVRDAGGRPLAEGLKVYLRDKDLLLLLDNFEQVAGAAPLVADLLATCPRLKVLVTSRALLNLRGERDFPVPPLALPDRAHPPRAEGLTQYDAVRLFIERAEELKPDFAVTNQNAPAVAEICHRLDGLPLAIELAAARIRLLPPEAMLARLERRLPLLIGGPRDLPARQQTLRNTIAWSHDLLSPAEQTLFRRMAVFVGGCTLDAAEAVCNVSGDLGVDLLDGVASLADRSLVRQQGPRGDDAANPTPGTDGEPRFVMLETIREFGMEQLAASGEADAMRQQHAAWYVTLAEAAQSELTGPQQGAWLARLEAEHDNLRAAFRWWEERDDAEQAWRLVEAQYWFWWVRDHVAEARERMARLLKVGAAAQRTGLRAKVLANAGSMAFKQSDYAAARLLAEESLTIVREVGDKEDLAVLLRELGIIVRQLGDHDAARSYMEQTLVLLRELGDTTGIADVLNDLANFAHDQGDYDTARSLYEESLSLTRQMDYHVGTAFVLNNLAIVAQDQGDLGAARTLFEECLATQRGLNEQRGIALSLANLANLAANQGAYGEAHALLAESLGIQQELGSLAGVAFVLERFAGLAAAQGQADRALRLAGAAAALRAVAGTPPQPAAQRLLEQRLEPARQALGDASSTAAWAEGQAMSHEQAVAYALAASGPS